MSHHCGFDFVDDNQPWAECSCGRVRTNPRFFAPVLVTEWNGLKPSYVVFDELNGDENDL